MSNKLLSSNIASYSLKQCKWLSIFLYASFTSFIDSIGLETENSIVIWSELEFTGSKLTVEIVEQGVKYFQS